MDLIEVLRKTIQERGSDLYILPGSPMMVKVRGNLVPQTEERISPADAEQILTQIYHLAQDRDMGLLRSSGDDDFSFSLREVGRFRCSAYRQRNSFGAVLRAVPFGIPSPETMQIPPQVMNLADTKRGMILVTGPAGSGKSTTLACLIDKINKTREGHIITIEDPIEYLHSHDKCLISQREVSTDTGNFSYALRAALRQAPDVILLGEMRDLETISTAMTAAETGHLLLSTLHTVGAAKTIDRIVDVFPGSQQQQIRVQLSMLLRAVVSQQLIPGVDGKLVPAFEIMMVDNAIASMIRDGKVHQLDNMIFAGAQNGMMSMDSSIQRLYQEGKISRDNALLYSVNRDMMEKRLR
ncbi:MAG: PilT/PilU family type 4a pilus ATPase [Clostridia bacterium]|nr:PilT/PilU family type 4a pilus ATPase [Clostridia bacterium]